MWKPTLFYTVLFLRAWLEMLLSHTLSSSEHSDEWAVTWLRHQSLKPPLATRRKSLYSSCTETGPHLVASQCLKCWEKMEHSSLAFLQLATRRRYDLGMISQNALCRKRDLWNYQTQPLTDHLVNYSMLISAMFSCFLIMKSYKIENDAGTHWLLAPLVSQISLFCGSPDLTDFWKWIHKNKETWRQEKSLKSSSALTGSLV